MVILSKNPQHPAPPAFSPRRAGKGETAMGARISRLIVALFGLTFLWIFGVIVFATGWFPLTP